MSLRHLVLLLALAAAACGLGPRDPSHVAQGRYFSTGDARYDEFFVRLYRMQVELKSAPERLAAMNAQVASAVGLPSSSDGVTLRTALAKKADEIGARGAPLSVRRGREPKRRPRLSVNGTPAASDRDLVELLEDAFVRLDELEARRSHWKKELEWLPVAATELDGNVEAAFVGQSRASRDEIHENLADAQKVVALMNVRVKEVDEQRGELEALLVAAIGEVKAEPPPAEPEPKAKPRAPARPAARASPPETSETPPARPKQATAKPDFEP